MDEHRDDSRPETVDFYDSANLIAEVKKRPPLYHKFCKDYNDKFVREKMWKEVCQAIIPNWSQLDEKNKMRTAREVQRKWKNIRDCFRKELNNDRKCEEGQGRRKRRKYIFFDHLLFLLPSMQQREKREDLVASSGEEDANENEDGGGSVNSDSSSSRPILWRHGSQQHPVYSYKEPDPVPANHHSNDIDQDKYFLLSLLPSLRVLNEQQKFTVKIEFLKILQSFSKGAESSAGSSSNVESSQNECKLHITQPKVECIDEDNDDY